ncbi:MAG: endonuclease/exonuclease/phosphatase family protein [bacterium]|nr:endonuclease/exonuclease/phosphatase family protein [bacterium]
MSEPGAVRVATYNIRNLRALDQASWWWRRRDRLGAALSAVDADIWGFQEVYQTQNRWLGTRAFGSGWEYCGRGRNRRGGGEMCPIWFRKSRFAVTGAAVRWFGETPARPGTRLLGARSPRLATVVEGYLRRVDQPFVVFNTHLDEGSQQRRLEASENLADWLTAEHAGKPAIVLGDLNCTLDQSPARPLMALGLRPVLNPDDGPTAHDFGKSPNPRQIDHIFVSEHWSITASRVVREAGNASDHWPVAADLEIQT